MTSVSQPLLVAQDVTMRFGGVTAIDRVSFCLTERELRCLIGPNGAGKSTFFKMLTGQLRPTAGTIRLRGREIGGAAPHAIARLGVGIKTQVCSLFDGLSVRENVAVAALRARRSGTVRPLVDDALARLQLTDVAGTDVARLAHGQRQWVELAMVLAQQPTLVLLDEPAAGMTHEEARRTAALIREVNRSHAVVVVEHDMQFIRSLATAVTVFDRGRILMEGSADEVLSDRRVRDVYLGHADAA